MHSVSVSVALATVAVHPGAMIIGRIRRGLGEVAPRDTPTLLGSVERDADDGYVAGAASHWCTSIVTCESGCTASAIFR